MRKKWHELFNFVQDNFIVVLLPVADNRVTAHVPNAQSKPPSAGGKEEIYIAKITWTSMIATDKRFTRNRRHVTAH